MFAFYILLAGLILSLPATVGIIVFWGTPMMSPVLAGFSFSFTPFIVAAFLHRQIKQLMEDAGH